VEGIIARGVKQGLLDVRVWDLRDYATDKHRSTDDEAYGGGPGMVMLAEPLAKAVAAARSAQRAAGYAVTRTIHLSPSGVPLTHQRVAELAAAESAAYVLVAGRYEGVDERFIAREVDEEIAIGDFVVSGGELPALMLIDAVVRQRPGVLNDAESAAQDSFVTGLLDCPHYTRPERLDGAGDDAGDRVPEVLLSGHHEDIRRWRLMQSLGRTRERRPGLLESRTLSKEESALLAAYGRESQEQQQQQ
jgi:tRNA (guanine37-N1)-methyltransferase